MSSRCDNDDRKNERFTAHESKSSCQLASEPELDIDWIHPWIGLDWIGSEVFFDTFVM